jgi:hypothetical protein
MSDLYNSRFIRYLTRIYYCVQTNLNNPQTENEKDMPHELCEEAKKKHRQNLQLRDQHLLIIN